MKTILLFLFILLIFSGIMINTASAQEQQIPQWLKKNALLWGQGQISDTEYIQGLQWLINSGMLKIVPDKQPAPVIQPTVPAAPKPTLGLEYAIFPTQSDLGPMWKIYNPTPSSLFDSQFDGQKSIEQIFQNTATYPPDTITVDEAEFSTTSIAMGAYAHIPPTLSQYIPEFDQLKHGSDVVCASTDQTLASSEKIDVSCHLGLTVWHIEAIGGAGIGDDAEKIIEYVTFYAHGT